MGPGSPELPGLGARGQEAASSEGQGRQPRSWNLNPAWPIQGLVSLTHHRGQRLTNPLPFLHCHDRQPGIALHAQLQLSADNPSRATGHGAIVSRTTCARRLCNQTAPGPRTQRGQHKPRQGKCKWQPIRPFHLCYKLLCPAWFLPCPALPPGSQSNITPGRISRDRHSSTVMLHPRRSSPASTTADPRLPLTPSLPQATGRPIQKAAAQAQALGGLPGSPLHRAAAANVTPSRASAEQPSTAGSQPTARKAMGEATRSCARRPHFRDALVGPPDRNPPPPAKWEQELLLGGAASTFLAEETPTTQPDACLLGSRETAPKCH